MMGFDTRYRDDQQTVKAVARLKFHDDFKVYTRFLQRELDNLRKKTDTATGDVLYWNQGKAQLLQIVLDLPDLASKIIKNNQ